MRREIVKRLADAGLPRARSPATTSKALMQFYEQGRKSGDFEAGIRMALQAMLASPQFLFRLEEAPADVRAGAELPHHRSRPRVAAVVLPLGHGARRRSC